MWPNADFVGTIYDAVSGVVEMFVGRCDAQHILTIPDKVWVIINGQGGGWVDIAVNNATVVYCWAGK